jgi:hypothetical protein
MLVVRHHRLILEEVLNVLESSEFRAGFLDHTLLGQLLLLLLED